MSESPSKNKDRVLAYSVYAGGKKLDDTYSLVSAEISLELNRIGKATLKFNAGNMDKQIFDESDAKFFVPGKDIRLDAGDMNSQETLFDGVIIGQRIMTGKDFRTYMLLECRDRTFAATQGRRSRIFENMNDSDIIKEVLSPYGSVDADATQYKHTSLVQYYCSDWDFALSRADACGLFVISEGGKIRAAKPDVDSAPALSLTFGQDIIEFNIELSSSDQFKNYEALSWSPKDLRPVRVMASAPVCNSQGDITPKKIASGESMLLQTDAPTEKEALKQWAESMAMKSVLARYQGSMTFYGTSKASPGALVEINGLGKRYNGKMFIGSVTHTIRDNEWMTEVGAGVSTMSITDEADVVSPPASGFLPGMQGLHSGIVRKLDGDPLGQSRIQVELPWLDSKENLLWVRLTSPYATKDSGIFFLPEVGDEILVGFMNNDPTHPVAIGSFYGEKQKPPYEFDAKNNTKAIITRSKLSIGFDEEKKAITVTTPGGNTIEISDDGKYIMLADMQKNEIRMDDKGISMTSNKDIKISAKGSITMEANRKIECVSKGDVSMEGTNVNVQAKVGASVKGTAKAELSASGQTTIKGAMVMIN